MREAHEHLSLLKELNYTIISLIPKAKCPKSVSEFIPISIVIHYINVSQRFYVEDLDKLLHDLIL